MKLLYSSFKMCQSQVLDAIQIKKGLQPNLCLREFKKETYNTKVWCRFKWYRVRELPTVRRKKTAKQHNRWALRVGIGQPQLCWFSHKVKTNLMLFMTSIHKRIRLIRQIFIKLKLALLKKSNLWRLRGRLGLKLLKALPRVMLLHYKLQRVTIQASFHLCKLLTTSIKTRS